ncbi:UNVERIFIED_CONTAM: Pleiotropic drug resistance protein 1 [Sesamum radiatum]|uniref:RING-type E3 ubiquitin transferase n=1 Tax=Sesamum radiatum TaxID=300843 RepID=A0AAW2JAN6_SESRA
MYTSNSFRGNASWRNHGAETFSNSTREEDDEEALKWAALEKLPTFDRLRKGLLLGSRGAANEVDVDDLGFQERRDLLERLVRVAEEDNEKFLLKRKKRIDRVGIELPRIEVRFEHLTVETEAYVGSRAMPSFMNFYTNILEEFSSYLRILPSRKQSLTILNDVSGILKPGRMTLLLGPPGCGKTTLLLALAGMLDPKLKFSGTVTYNGHGMNEFIPQRSAAYISQHDVHIGEMTVRETLAFSARCQGVGSNHEMLAELSRREKAANIKPDPDVDIYMKAAAIEGQEASIVTDYILKILGLDICADTLVGDEMIRGISGGQRKRVTTGEMLVGPAKALFMDEISTGLDSSTTFQVVNSIRQSIHILEGTILVSLLQPEPETFDLFDDIILMSEGQIVYQGPSENVLEFFQSMGFKCPDRKGVADFLQEVTSKKDQQQYWADHEKPYRFITVKEFADAFKLFHIGQKLNGKLATPFDKTKSHPAALTTKEYGVSKMELLKACASRELLLMRRNSFIYIFNLSQISLMGLIAMTVFLRPKMHRDNVLDGRKFSGALFYTVTQAMFNGMADIAMIIQKLPVFYKQRGYFFFPAWAYALPLWISKIPVSVVGIAAFTVLTYYEMDWIQILEEKVKKWWIWGYYISPMMYADNAIVVNEFRGHSWRHVVSNTNVSLGVEVIKSLGFFPSSYWYWIGVGALSGMILLFNCLCILAMTYLHPLGKPQAVLPDDDHENSTERIDQTKRDVVLPFEPHSITFDDVKYSVDMPQEMKSRGATEDRLLLLKGVSGAFRPGVLTALMGVSGAVYESLLFSAWLRLPPEVDSQTRKAFVENVMELVELTSLRGGLVGLPGISGLSTEQRKRLTIAVELVANPSIIFMDEPTSGLDARAAAIVMRTLLLMKRGGQEIYVGPLGRQSCNLIQYFEGIQGVPKIRDGYNPATWMLEVTSSAQEMMLGVDFAEIYRNSELYRRNKALINELSTPNPGTKDLHFQTEYSQPFLTQCIACLWKQHWSYWRNPLYSAVRILYTAFLALMFGSMFWDLGSKRDTEQDLINAMGSMYASVFFLGVQLASSVQPVVAVERTVFYRERAAGLYSAFPYAFGQAVIEVPYCFAQATIYGTIVYAMIGFQWTAAKYFWYIFFMFFTLLYFTLYGMMAVAATPNQHIAHIISFFFYALWNLFSGFVIPRPRTPVWWRWYHWANPVAWTLYGLVASHQDPQFLAIAVSNVKDLAFSPSSCSSYQTHFSIIFLREEAFCNLHKYDRIGEINKECAFVLQSAAELKPDDSRLYTIKEELSFLNGDWWQELNGAGAPLMPFDDRELSGSSVDLRSPVNLVSFWVTDVDRRHQSKNSIFVSGLLQMGITLEGSSVLPSRQPDSGDPWGWVKEFGYTNQPLLTQDDQIILVLRYPRMLTLASRAIRGSMRSLNPKSNLKYFDEVHMSSWLSTSANYQFTSENLVSRACDPYPYKDSLLNGGIDIYKGLDFCVILERFTHQEALTILPNWKCNGTDEFCSKLGPFVSDKEINATDGSFRNVKLVLQDVRCENMTSKENAGIVRVSSVFRAVPPSENQFTAAQRTGLSNMTLSAEGIWKSSSGQLCMVGCSGSVDGDGNGCDTRICLYVPLSFSIKQRSILLGTLSSIEQTTRSYFPLAFEKLVPTAELWDQYTTSHPYYKYSKIEAASAVLEKDEPFNIGTVIKKSLLKFPKLEDMEKFPYSLSLLSEDLTLHIPAVPDHFLVLSPKTDLELEILSLGPLFGRYWLTQNVSTFKKENPYQDVGEYTEKQLLLMCLLSLILWETTRWLVNPTARISIVSQRNEDDPLYFVPIKLQTVPIMYRKQREDILSRRGVEGILRILTLSTAIACILSQLFYIRDNMESAPYVSLVMLGVQALGYTLPLITGAEALFRKAATEFNENESYDLQNSQWTRVIDYTVKFLVLVAFSLTLRLCQKVWKSRIRMLTRTPLEPHRVPSDKKSPIPNPYFSEEYEFVNPRMDFYSKFGDIAIPTVAILLALAVYIQQRWNYEKLSQTLILGQRKLLPLGSKYMRDCHLYRLKLSLLLVSTEILLVRKKMIQNDEINLLLLLSGEFFMSMQINVVQSE